MKKIILVVLIVILIACGYTAVQKYRALKASFRCDPVYFNSSLNFRIDNWYQTAILRRNVPNYLGSECFMDKELLIGQMFNTKIPNLATDSGPTVSLNGGKLVGKYESDGIGQWQMQYDTDFLIQDDFENNGTQDVATILYYNGGGSGHFTSLIIFEREDGALKYITNQYLGDRIKINSVDFKHGVFYVDMITQGPNEGFCCGTLHRVVKYKMVNSTLVELKD